MLTAYTARLRQVQSPTPAGPVLAESGRQVRSSKGLRQRSLASRRTALGGRAAFGANRWDTSDNSDDGL